VGQDPLELCQLDPLLRVARLGLLRHPLDPPLDVIRICDEQLQPQPLQVAGGIDVRPEAPHDGQERVHSAQPA
jgi:hypothetical protein